jgi:hypothetical protein
VFHGFEQRELIFALFDSSHAENEIAQIVFLTEELTVMVELSHVAAEVRNLNPFRVRVVSAQQLDLTLPRSNQHLGVAGGEGVL